MALIRFLGRLEAGIIDHVSYESISGCVLRITGDQLLPIFTLEEIEHAGAVADDLQIGVVHGQFAEPEDAAAMVDVSGRAERRLEGRWTPAGIEYQDDGVTIDGNMCNAAVDVGRGRQGGR